MDKAAVSRASSHGVTLEVKTDLRFPTGPNGERLPSYVVAVGCDVDGAAEQREAALADLKNFMTPADTREIEAWIAELSVITAGRGREGFDAELMVSAYSSRLRAFPADVVRWALLKKSWKWFPTWDELEKACKAKSGPREHMIYALSKPPSKPEAPRARPTAEEKERIAALVAEKFPGVPEYLRNRAVDEITKGGDEAAKPFPEVGENG